MRIYHAAQLVGVSTMTLRRLEKLGVIKPQRDRNGWRHYEIQDLEAARAYLFPQNPHSKKNSGGNNG